MKQRQIKVYVLHKCDVYFGRLVKTTRRHIQEDRNLNNTFMKTINKLLDLTACCSNTGAKYVKSGNIENCQGFQAAAVLQIHISRRVFILIARIHII